MSDRPWWQDAVVYQVYPRSFADSDGDGVGDLRGVTSRLDYLAELGVDAIWLTPFYPSPLADGGYDVSDYTDVDPRLGTLADFDDLVGAGRARGIRVLVDLVPNHCSAAHPLFQAALAATPGSPERDRFIFRPGRGVGGDEPPNNWPSNFGGPAWSRVPDGSWYLHLFDASQPDFNWRHPDVVALFEEVLRFWLDRGVAGFRVDVAHGVFKDPLLADAASTVRSVVPSPYYHRPEVHDLYRDWRAILHSYPASGWPGERTAIGEVWYDTPATLRPYLASDGLPQVFNFDLIMASWGTAALRAAIDATHALSDGSRAPWVLGNHDVVRPVTRFGRQEARAAALLQLALPGSAYIYQGEELGLPEVVDIPDAARADPAFRRTGGKLRGRDGCRVPLPWTATGSTYGFSPDFSLTDRTPVTPIPSSPTGPSASPSSPFPPWLPQPAGWGDYSVEAQAADPDSFLSLYQAALRLRRSHPALGAGGPLRWLGSGRPLDGPVPPGGGPVPPGGGPVSAAPPPGGPADAAPSPEAPEGTLHFARDPGLEFFANLGTANVPLPPHREILLSSGPLLPGEPAQVPPGTAAWLAV